MNQSEDWSENKARGLKWESNPRSSVIQTDAISYLGPTHLTLTDQVFDQYHSRTSDSLATRNYCVYVMCKE